MPATSQVHFLLFLLALVVTSRCTMAASRRSSTPDAGSEAPQRREMSASAFSLSRGDPYNLRSNQLMALSDDDDDPDYTSDGRPSQAPEPEKYQLPKRTLALFTRWKTLEQLKKSLQNPLFPLSQHQAAELVGSAATTRQQKKTKASSLRASEELNVAIPSLLTDSELSASPRIAPRASQRSQRPPGQPLRWG